MTQPSGWYDDPKDPSQLRYWDGVVWSDHVTPKVSPTVEQSNIGMPYGVTPAAARREGSGSPQQDQGQGQQGGQWTAYGQGPGQLAPSQAAWQSHPSTTPDGVQLAGWWLRVGARLLDFLFTFLLSLPFAGWFMYRYLVGVGEWSRDLAAQIPAGSAPIFAMPPPEVVQYGSVAWSIWLLVAAAYEVFFLRRRGATPGKQITGISVRPRGAPGPLPMKAILGRTVSYFLAIALLSVLSLIDVLWPLWDDKKQALHDKVAATNVIVGPQYPMGYATNGGAGPG